MKTKRSDNTITINLLRIWRVEILTDRKIMNEFIPPDLILSRLKSTDIIMDSCIINRKPGFHALRFLVDYFPLIPQRGEKIIKKKLFPVLNRALLEEETSKSELLKTAAQIENILTRKQKIFLYLIAVINTLAIAACISLLLLKI